MPAVPQELHLWPHTRLPAGLQAPAANHKGDQQGLAETFSLSNISPQVGKGFNRWGLLTNAVWIATECPAVGTAQTCIAHPSCCLHCPCEHAATRCLHQGWAVVAAAHVLRPIHPFDFCGKGTGRAACSVIAPLDYALSDTPLSMPGEASPCNQMRCVVHCPAWLTVGPKVHFLLCGLLLLGLCTCNHCFALAPALKHPCPSQGRDYWARFERFVKQTTDVADDVFIVTGPLYVPQLTSQGYVMQHPMIGALLLLNRDS